jgi:hypothetical protein
MDFNQFLQEAWRDHQNDATAVAGRLNAGVGLIQENGQIPAFANLAAHVFGEHLGQWEKGITLLEGLRNLSSFVLESESGLAVTRSIAALRMAGGDDRPGDLSTSDRIRALAMAASALSAQSQTSRSQELFRSALELAVGSPLDRNDPANRVLAVTGNNMACALEEKENRSPLEDEMMILAAETARKYWEIAGGWIETERAEYRLAMSHLKAGNAAEALRHARLCLQIAQTNQAEPLEIFFGNEALALAERALGNAAGYGSAVDQARNAFAGLSDDDKAWCEPTLKGLR